MPTTFRFDPDRVAYAEAAGWRAYYVTRAAAAWVPIDHDSRKVKHDYAMFYRLARRYSGLEFDPEQVSKL